jgi:hypothetical protein
MVVLLLMVVPGPVTMVVAPFRASSAPPFVFVPWFADGTIPLVLSRVVVGVAAAGAGAGVVVVLVAEVVSTNDGSWRSRRASSRSRHEATTIAVSADAPAAPTMIFQIVALRFVRSSEVIHRGFVGSMLAMAACDMPLPDCGRADVPAGPATATLATKADAPTRVARGRDPYGGPLRLRQTRCGARSHEVVLSD